MRQDGKLYNTGLCHLHENSAETGAMEGWPSGLRRTPGKRVGVKAPPGFESPSLRHTPLLNISFNYALYLIIRYITYTYAYILL